ncbi:MAG: WYL domain-containing protein [Leptospira sp.]|nr:WYL domain-containing protein [Leptospira sp.]
MNPKTRETAVRLNLIRLLSSSPNGLSFEELKKGSGISSEAELKKALGKLYMVGTYPYTPLDYLELEYDGARVRLLIPQNIDKTIVLTSREWILLRDSLESQLAENGSTLLKSEVLTIQDLLLKIKKIVPYNTIESFSSMKKIIRDSIAKKKSLEFKYKTREDKNISNEDAIELRKVDPWYLLESSIDYLVAYCHSRKNVRIFRLESIFELQSTASSFEFPSEQLTQNAIDQFQRFLISSSNESELATIWHTRESFYHLNLIFELKVTKNIKTFGETEMIQSVCKIRDHQWFIESILSFLPDVIIHEPIDLKEKFLAYINKAKQNSLIINSRLTE